MGVVMFYHLTHSTAEDTVQSLIGRALKQGWRVMIRGVETSALERLDAQLWLGPEDGFVPHGMEGGPHDADQPVLIGQGAAVNGAQALALLDGAEVTAEEIAQMDRVWVLFNGADQDRLTRARQQWKAFSSSGADAQYWSEDSGKWERKADNSKA